MVFELCQNSLATDCLILFSFRHLQNKFADLCVTILVRVMPVYINCDTLTILTKINIKIVGKAFAARFFKTNANTRVNIRVLSITSNKK